MKKSDNYRYLNSRIKERFENLESKLQFVSVVDKIRKKACIRTYACRKSKQHGIQCKEILREFLNHTLVSDDLYFSNLCGYRVVFEKRKNGYYILEPTNKMSIAMDNWHPNIYIERLYTEKELEETFKDEIPYLQLGSIDGINSPIEMLRAYKDHNIEMLVKNGLGYLAANQKGIKRLTANNQKIMLKWIYNNLEYCQKYKPTFAFIIMAMKNNETGEQFRSRCYIENDRKYLLKNGIALTYERVAEIKKYLENQQCDITTYCDYLKASAEIGRDMTQRGVQFPRNLQEQHDSIKIKLDAKKNAKINRKLKKINAELIKYITKYKSLQIVVPKTQNELVVLGNKLHNCVGTYGYGEKMAKGNCIILAIYKNDDPVECCELIKNQKGKLEINQLYGDHNQRSSEHSNAEKLVNKFIRNYQSKRITTGV